jgi:transcriptional regulator with XRE-family HTH domain
MADTESIGKRIAGARKRAGLTQSQLGAKVGSSRVTVVRWESDQQRPDGETLGRLAQTLKVEEGWILRGGAFDSTGGAEALFATPIDDPAYRLGHRHAIDAIRKALDEVAVLPPPVPAANGGLGDALFPRGAGAAPAPRPAAKRRKKSG